jgi:UDP-N-acetylmuramate dehydrogenase
MTDYEWLKSVANHDVRLNEKMSLYTSLNLGGPADAFVQVSGVSQLKAVLKESGQRKISVSVLGAGTNVLVRDKGIRGIVVRLAGEFDQADQFSL